MRYIYIYIYMMHVVTKKPSMGSIDLGWCSRGGPNAQAGWGERWDIYNLSTIYIYISIVSMYYINGIHTKYIYIYISIIYQIWCVYLCIYIWWSMMYNYIYDDLWCIIIYDRIFMWVYVNISFNFPGFSVWPWDRDSFDSPGVRVITVF